VADGAAVVGVLWLNHVLGSLCNGFFATLDTLCCCFGSTDHCRHLFLYAHGQLGSCIHLLLKIL
jgi:hypothetical protein